MKRFVLLAMAVCMLFCMCCGFAIADGPDAPGDKYIYWEPGYPLAHWAIEDPIEVKHCEEKGWERYTGVLWYDSNNHAADFIDVNVNEIQDLYNQGYTFHILYSWICDASKLEGKNQEQSVSVGQWILSPEEAIAFHKTYTVPEINFEGKSHIEYRSQWYYKGEACSAPDGTETADILKDIMLVRAEFSCYDKGYGSKLYLKNGEEEMYKYDEAVAIGGFEGEMPVWN